MLIQEHTVFNFRKFKKNLEANEIERLPQDKRIKDILLKRRGGAKGVFIGIVSLAVIFYIVTEVMITTDTFIILGSIAFLTIATAMGYFVYNKYSKDIRQGEMHIMRAEIESVELNDNPLRSKVRMKLESGREFYMPSMAFPKNADYNSLLGKQLSVYFSPLSNEVLYMEGEGFAMEGYN